MKNFSVTINWVNLRLKEKTTVDTVHLANDEDHAFEIALASLKARNTDFLKWNNCSIQEVVYPKSNDLGNAVLNQVEADMGMADFTSWSQLIEALCLNPDNVNLLTEYLSEFELNRLNKGLTTKRY